MAKRHILYSWWSLTSAFYDGNDNSLCLLETHSLTHPVITFTVHHLAHVVSPSLLIFLQVGMGLWGETSRFVRRTVNTNILFYVIVKVQHSNRLWQDFKWSFYVSFRQHRPKYACKGEHRRRKKERSWCLCCDLVNKCYLWEKLRGTQIDGYLLSWTVSSCLNDTLIIILSTDGYRWLLQGGGGCAKQPALCAQWY